MTSSPDIHKLPWMKFFPADWRADPALRMCSLAARGLWTEMLCIMHEAHPRGSLLIHGRAVSDKQLASLSGATVSQTTTLLAELEVAGVFSRTESGTIFSRRMQRDQQKAERDKANGRMGGNPKLKAGVNPTDKTQKPDARCSDPDNKIQGETKKKTRANALAAPWLEADWDRFWDAFPNKVGKAEARKAFDKATRKVTPELLFPALDIYAKKTDDRPFCNPSTWLNQERWHDEPAANNRENRTSSPKTFGSDAIIAVATRKARELDRNDPVAWPAREVDFACGTSFVGSGSNRDQRDTHRVVGVPCKFESDA